MKINDISTEFGRKLGAHIKNYIGTAIPGLLDGDYTGEKGVYKLYLEKATFLNTKGSLTAYLFTEKNDAVFCIIPKITDQPFSTYFPQMVPKSPWLAAPENLDFPNLPAITVSGIKWYYVYATGDDSIKKMWPSISATIGADQNLLQKWQAVSRHDESIDHEGWRGGLFYTGTLPSIPESDLIPEFAKSGWGFFKNKVTLQGCVYRTPLLPYLNLQIPILEELKPFGEGTIEGLELSIVFASPLMAAKQPVSLLPAKKGAARQHREIGLAGALLFKSGSKIDLAGYWALDDDAFFIKANCKLADLKSYLDKSGIIDQVRITEVEAGTVLKISKSEKLLESIMFKAAIHNLPVIEDIFTIEAASLTVSVQYPAKLNVVTASFSGVARLGKGNVQLICNGKYPNGEYNLYLDPDPKKQLYFTDIVNIFDSHTGLESDKAITRLSGKYNSANTYFALEMAVADGARLTLDKDQENQIGFRLNSLAIGIYGKKTFSFKVDADFSYLIKPGRELKFTGSAAYDQGWQLSAQYKGDVTLKEIIDSFKLGDAPKELSGVTFRQLALVYDKQAKISMIAFAGNIGLSLYGRNVNMLLKVRKVNTTTHFSGTFSITQQEEQDAQFNVEFLKIPTGYKLSLQLIFTIGDIDLYLQASRDTTGEDALAHNLFKGGAGGLSISLSDLLKSYINAPFGDVMPDGFLPELMLNDIYVSYDGATKQTDIIGLAQLAGKEIRIFIQRSFNEEGTAQYAFGIDTNVDSLTGLPLVGAELKDVTFSNVGFVYTSSKGDYLLPQLNEPDDEDAMPEIEFAEEATAYRAGITLSGSINLPTEDEPIVIMLPVSRQTAQYLLLGADNVYALTTGAKSFDPAVKWINVNKKMGPLALDKLGFKFEDGRLSLLISGAISLADLSVNVEGLGLSFSLSRLIHGQNIEPKFNLDGLGLALKKDPLEISGMLLRAPNKEGETLSFYGSAQIATSGFTIKGVGGYAVLADKSASLFIYGLYNGPIGGPSFFFVTGIAAGFGYNRTVRVPSLEEVKQFPLVSMALSPEEEPTSLTELLEELVTGQWIPTSPGDYWLAMGIRFTSFNLIDSFVLVTAKFGNKLEFAIIGLSLLKWPAKGTPIVYIELALLAKFGPDSDVIAITGMLTDNSFILNKNCKLTGGFAFYTWISGEHEGDFVITLGGYRPGYEKPAHYPTVDRLALNWKFSDELSLMGEMYFALTPKEIMAGGKWELAYNLSFLSARVIIWADMLIRWAPFEYYLSAGIIVRIEANIKILFVHVHFKLQLSCVVQIWGPPFAGQIYVDWTIFSFTIGFGGAPRKLPQALVWDAVGQNSEEAGFQESFVPKKEGVPCIIDARIIKGVENQTDLPDPDKPLHLQSAGEEKTDTTYVNGYEVVIAIDSFFPLDGLRTANTSHSGKLLKAGESPQFKQLEADTLMEVAGSDIPKTLAQKNTDIGIKPMKVKELKATMNVWLTREGNVITDNITVIGSAKGVNNALWGKDDKAPNVLQDALTGIKLQAVEAVDTSMIDIKLDEDRYEEKDPKKNLSLLKRTEPELPGDDVIVQINKILAGNPAAQDVAQLKKIGFNLRMPDELVFDDTLYSTPDYMASIGQMLPKNIM